MGGHIRVIGEFTREDVAMPSPNMPTSDGGPAIPRPPPPGGQMRKRDDPTHNDRGKPKEEKDVRQGSPKAKAGETKRRTSLSGQPKSLQAQVMAERHQGSQQYKLIINLFAALFDQCFSMESNGRCALTSHATLELEILIRQEYEEKELLLSRDTKTFAAIENIEKSLRKTLLEREQNEFLHLALSGEEDRKQSLSKTINRKKREQGVLPRHIVQERQLLEDEEQMLRYDMLEKEMIMREGITNELQQSTRNLNSASRDKKKGFAQMRSRRSSKVGVQSLTVRGAVLKAVEDKFAMTSNATEKILEGASKAVKQISFLPGAPARKEWNIDSIPVVQSEPSSRPTSGKGTVRFPAPVASDRNQVSVSMSDSLASSQFTSRAASSKGPSQAPSPPGSRKGRDTNAPRPTPQFQPETNMEAIYRDDEEVQESYTTLIRSFPSEAQPFRGQGEPSKEADEDKGDAEFKSDAFAIPTPPEDQKRPSDSTAHDDQPRPGLGDTQGKGSVAFKAHPDDQPLYRPEGKGPADSKAPPDGGPLARPADNPKAPPGPGAPDDQTPYRAADTRRVQLAADPHPGRDPESEEGPKYLSTARGSSFSDERTNPSIQDSFHDEFIKAGRLGDEPEAPKGPFPKFPARRTSVEYHQPHEPIANPNLVNLTFWVEEFEGRARSSIHQEEQNDRLSSVNTFHDTQRRSFAQGAAREHKSLLYQYGIQLDILRISLTEDWLRHTLFVMWRDGVGALHIQKEEEEATCRRKIQERSIEEAALSTSRMVTMAQFFASALAALLENESRQRTFICDLEGHDLDFNLQIQYQSVKEMKSKWIRNIIKIQSVIRMFIAKNCRLRKLASRKRSKPVEVVLSSPRDTAMQWTGFPHIPHIYSSPLRSQSARNPPPDYRLSLPPLSKTEYKVRLPMSSPAMSTARADYLIFY